MAKKKRGFKLKVKTREKRQINFRNVYYFLKISVVVFLSLFILGLAKDCSGLGGSCGGRKDKGTGLFDIIGGWFADLGDWLDDLGDNIVDWIDEHRIISPGDSNHQIDKDDPNNGDQVEGGDNGGDGTGDDIGGGTTPKYNIYTVKCYITETPVEPAYFTTTTKEEDGKLLEYPTAPTRDGYEFEYWKKYGDDTASKDAIYDVHTEDTEYIAVFKEVDYSGNIVSFYLDVADLETDTPYFAAETNKYGRIISFPENPPTRDDGYVFSCWQFVYEEEMTGVANIDLVYKVSTSYVALFVEPTPGEGDDDTGGNTGGDNTGGDNTGDDNTGGGNNNDYDEESDDYADIRYNNAGYVEYNPYDDDLSVPDDFWEGRDESYFYISFYVRSKDNGDFASPSSNSTRYYFTGFDEVNAYDQDGDGLHDSTGEPVRVCPYEGYCHNTDIRIKGNFNTLNTLIRDLDGNCVMQDCIDDHKEVYIIEEEGLACLTYGDGTFFVIGGRASSGRFVAADLYKSISSGVVFEVMPYEDYEPIP